MPKGLKKGVIMHPLRPVDTGWAWWPHPGGVVVRVSGVKRPISVK